MGRISGLKSKMSAGRINPGKYQMSNTRWEEKESKKGDNQIFFCQTLIDTSGAEHELSLFAMSTTAYGSDERNVEINKKGQLVTVDKDADVRINRNMGAGKYLDSLNDQGFSPKKLDNIDIEPGGLDGQWIEIDTPPSGKTDDKGNPYTDIVVVGLIDGPKSGSKGAAAKKAVAKSAAADEEEEEESGEEEEESELDATDDEIDAAVEFTQQVLGDPDTHVRNFDSEANGGGVTLQELNTSAFKHCKAKGAMKAKVAALVGDPQFHQLHADNNGWEFDEDEGVAKLAAPKKNVKKK